MATQTTPTDTWVSGSYEEYLVLASSTAFERAKGYFAHDRFVIEVAPQGAPHSTDWEVLTYAVRLFCTALKIPARGMINATLRHPGLREAQPDLAYFLREKAAATRGITGILDLRAAPVPDIVVELGASSLLSDLGPKRMLYEEMGVAEYWVEDVARTVMLGWAISGGASAAIRESRAIPGLTFDVLEEALRLNRQTDPSQAGAMLLERITGLA